LGNDYLVPVSVTDSDGRPKYRLEDGSDECLPYLAYGDETYLGAVLKSQSSFLQKSSQFDNRGESTFAEGLRAGVRGGLGLAWLPLGLVERDLDTGGMAIAGQLKYCIPLDVELYRNHQTTRPEVEETWELLRGYGERHQRLQLPEVKGVNVSEDEV